MNFFRNGGACALPLLLAVVPAAAHADDSTPAILAVGQRADEHGPAAIMGEHVHRKGEFMIGLAWSHDDFGGANRSGSRTVDDHEIAAAGFTARTRAMRMDMAMLHLMWAPSDRITLTAMPMWTRMEMTMLGIGEHDAAGEKTGTGHHGLVPGQTARHAVAGIGDTELGALVALARKPSLAAHAGLAVSIPTGSVSRRDASGNYVHYGMQPGSGTWDVIPSLTMTGGGDALHWGAQARYRLRAESRNSSGFRFGDRFDANVWLARSLSPAAAITARLAYRDEGRIKGHYNASHNHSAPPDRQANYGGRMVEAGLGANLVVGGNLRLGAEASVPLHQHVNGFQAPKNFGIALNLARMF